MIQPRGRALTRPTQSPARRAKASLRSAPDRQHDRAHQQPDPDGGHRGQPVAELSPVMRMHTKAITGIENLATLSNIPDMTRPFATSPTASRKLRYIRYTIP